MIPGFLPVFKNGLVSMCSMGATLKHMAGPLIRKTLIASSGHAFGIPIFPRKDLSSPLLGRREILKVVMGRTLVRHIICWGKVLVFPLFSVA